MEDRFNGGLFIKSLYVGMSYWLVLNETMIGAMIEAAKLEDAVRVFLEAMDEAALFPGGEEALAATCAKRAEAPMTPARALKLLKERRNAQQEAKREASLAKDGRIVLKAPPRDGEVRKPALAIDAALAGLNSLDVPVRNLNGRLAEVVKVPTPGLHRYGRRRKQRQRRTETDRSAARIHHPRDDRRPGGRGGRKTYPA